MLIIANRDLTDLKDGPQEVLEHYQETTNATVVNAKDLFHLNTGVHSFNIKYNYQCYKYLMRQNVEDQITYFPIYMTPVFTIILLRKKFKQSSIGYDSFLRNHILLHHRRLGLKNILKNYLYIIYYFILERTLSKFLNNVHFVSNNCTNFFNTTHNSSIGKTLPINAVSSLSAAKMPQPHKREATIFGPFLHDYDLYDLNITLQKLKNIGISAENITLIGNGATSIPLDTQFKIKIDWIGDYEEYIRTSENIFVINRTAAAGIQTRAQKLLRYQKVVFVHNGIDVGPIYNEKVRYL